MAGVPMLVPSTIVEAMGLRVSYADTVDLGGATGAGHGVAGRGSHPRRPGARRAVRHRVAPPTARRVHSPSAAGQPLGRDTSAWAEFEVPFGNVGANVGYAMIANRYLHEHDCSPEELAKIAVHQRDNACRNPDAFFYGQPITVDDVLGSPMVADPLHLLEIVMPSAGAAALVVVAPRPRAQHRSGRRPGCSAPASASPTRRSPTRPSLTDTAIKPAADRAFAQAGIERGQIGLASLYDCYTITVLRRRWRRPASAGRARAGASSPSTTCAGTATSR